MRNGSAAKIQTPFDLQPGLALDYLRHQLAQHDLLGEVLRANHEVGPTSGGAARHTNDDREHDDRSKNDPVAPRSSARIRQMSGGRQCGVGRQRQDRRRQRAGENHRRVHHRQAAEDVVAQATGADGRGDGRRAHTNHHGDAQTRHDRWQRERPLDLPQDLARGQAHRDRALHHRGRHALQPGDGAAQYRQHRVHSQRQQGRACANTANERQRDQEPEQGQARYGLCEVREANDRP